MMLQFLCISIHALREEGDRPIVTYTHDANHISIHALREEGDGFCARHHSMIFVFLSTPSARRATLGGGRYRININHFYPRPPRGGRRLTRFKSSGLVIISIHALREEGDSSVF